MPWNAKDAPRHTAKADTPAKKKQWKDVANSALDRGDPEGVAVRKANAVAKKAKGKGR